MSTSGISGAYGSMQTLFQEFQQLGAALSSGNLSSAQADFVTLQADMPQANSTSSASHLQSQNPLAQAFSKLSQDLKSGNLAAAQKDYSTIQQDFKTYASQVHHHHKSGESQQNQFSQLFEQLGQDLQSGNLSGAQTAFTSLQQIFESNGQSATSGTSTGSTSGGLSVIA